MKSLSISDMSASIVERIFDASSRWGDGRPWEDDATVVVLKRDA